MDKTRKSWIVPVTVSIASLALLGPAFAPRGVAEERHEVERWRHGDIRHFHERDLGRWRGGRWFHGEHFGRLGWWWIVDGVWYFYPTPVYPYPDPYVPPAVVVQAPPPSPSPAAAAPQYWYYCSSVKEYYPYVSHCPEGWMKVVPQVKPPGQ